MLVVYTILILAAVYCLLLFFPYIYWKKKGVPYKIYFPYIDGLVALMLQKIDISGYVTNVLYNNFPDSRYFGTFFMFHPGLMVKDVDLIKELFIKNFDHFVDHHGIINFENEPLWSKNLFNMKGQIWKEMRSTLSPSFTSSQMKNLFLLIDECAKNYVEYFANEPGETIKLELKDLFKRFTIDVIANAAFGIQINSLKDKENDFYMYGKDINKFDGPWNMIKYSIITSAPKLATKLNWYYINPTYSKFFQNVMKNSLDYRKQHNIHRHDMIQLLLNVKQENGEGLSENEIISQAFLFFTAGSDTVSTAMYFLAYELALNPDVQEKLRQEIEDSKEKNDVSYESVMNLPYLDMVLSESLRKNPLLFATDRVCTKPYQIKPINSDEKPLDINVGDHLWIPLSAFNNDPKYFPNPEKFDPDRFLDKNLKNTFFPFGVGPRMCIAYRFAIMEVKTLIFHLISNFEIVPTKETPIPFTLVKGVIRTETNEDLWFEFRKRNI